MWICLECAGWPCIPFFLLTFVIGNLVVRNSSLNRAIMTEKYTLSKSICKLGFNQCPELLSENLFDAHQKNIHQIFSLYRNLMKNPVKSHYNMKRFWIAYILRTTRPIQLKCFYRHVEH
jgi:hypothetical protein